MTNRFAASLTCLALLAGHATAAPIALEDFESYTIGSTASGGSGGSGWTGNWTIVNDTTVSSAVVSGGLNYAAGSVVNNGGSKALEFTYAGESITDGLMSRALGSSQTGTVYMSMLFRDTVNPDLIGSTDFVQFGFDNGTDGNPNASVMRRNNELQVRSSQSTSASASDSTSAAVGTTFMLVLKAEKTSNANYNNISIFINPTSDIEPGSANATSATNSGVNALDHFIARSAFHENGDKFQIDSILIGTTFADVVPVPEPSSLALLGLGGLLVVRRRRG